MQARLFSITKKKDFDAIFKKGRSAFDKRLGIRAALNQEGKVRLGVIISLKVSKKAVLRNRLKRRLKEIVRARLAEIRPDLDLLIIALPGAADLTFDELRQSVENNFKRLRIGNDRTIKR